jgi:HK97 family phage major capsid protein
MFDAGAPDNKGGGFDLLGKQLADLGESHKTQIEGVKSQITTVVNKQGELETIATEGKVAAQKALEKAEDLEKKMSTSGMGGQGQVKSFDAHVEEKLNQHKADLPLSVGKKFSFEINTKVVGNMGSAANLTGSYFVAPTVVPGVINQPYNQTHLRNVLATGNTNSNMIRYVRDNGGEGGPTMVAEGAGKPQMDRDLAIVDAPVRKVATYLRVPEEMIEDIPFLTSFLSSIGTEEVLAIEDAQILYGDGTGQNLSGLGTAGNFTAFAADAGGGAASGVIASPNNYDVLRFADKQMRVLKRTPSIALVSPVDYVKMISTKDSTGNYILSGGGNGLIPTVNGFPVVQMNQVAAGDFFVIDRNAAQIFFRSNITVRFYEQDQDNAIKNLVTIVIEERLALPIYYVTGIIKGTFAAAITDLTS